MSRTLLISEIEARLDAWQRILEHKRKESAPKKRGLTITISRQFGCEAFPLAERLKVALEESTGEEWVIFDRALIEKAAQELGVSAKILKNIEERNRFFDFFSSFFSKSYTKNQVLNKIEEYVLSVARAGNAIIVGRGGAFITRELDNCFHFKLEASLDFRIKSIAERMDIDHSAARKFVIENSEKREKFLRDFFEEDVNKSKFFHAIFNNEKLKIEVISESILKCIEPAIKKPFYS